MAFIVKIFSNSKVSIIGFTSDIFDIYEIGDKMNKKGWNLNMLQNPKSIHLCITLQHVNKNIKDQFVKNIKETLKELKELDNGLQTSKKAALYGSMLEMNETQVSTDILKEYLNTVLHV